jgi:hypothetical protein
MNFLRIISFVLSLVAIGLAIYAISERRKYHNELLEHIKTSK